ncbi:MAG: DUF4330 family protein [Candidatus Altiarchaeales archaeon]|nr:DUF4330 family protein [Candidatus Altiarchaeales archaeon]
MVLVDSGGRVFGRVSVVDLMVAVVLLAVLAIVVKLFVLGGPETWVYVEVQLCERNPNPMYTGLVKCGQSMPLFADAVSRGDVVYLGDAPVGEILEVDSFPVLSDLYDINLRVRLKAEIDENSRVFFDNSELKAGSNIRLDTGRTSVVGVVSRLSLNSLSEVQPKFTSKNVALVLYSVRPWLADSINVGDRDVDFKNDMVYAVVSGKSVLPAEVFTLTDDGRVLREYNPLFNDVLLNVSVMARVERGRLMYRGSEIKVGGRILVLAGENAINGTITDVW